MLVQLRIEMQIFSLHWMMLQASGFTDIKKPNVLHHPVQAKNLHFNPYIYILYLSNILNYLPPNFAGNP